MMKPGIALLLLATVTIAQSPSSDSDTDQDGLSDFLERHKYLTDPSKKDTDGDGVPDGDWNERREYAYTVRTIVQVIRPADVAAMNDDFQDARVLDSTPEYVELEVIHYPFNTVNDTIVGDPRWRENVRKMKEWLEPGPTANWDAAMAAEMTAALAKDGIDAKALSDKDLVTKAAAWLCDRAKYEDGFTTFLTAFDGKRPFVPEETKAGIDKELARLHRSIEEQWDRELFAKGMFQNKTRGSCTSSAIYLNGCLRALGIPTRIILVIPVVDANDDREVEMARKNLTHHEVRKTVVAALDKLRGSWSSHTFNEVWVGGRWRRLNYQRLGQPILDAKLYGLTTHVATFHDWADAAAWKTIGKRQAQNTYADAFGGPNPYSAIYVADRFGAHCNVPNPPVEELHEVTIDLLIWADDPSVPKSLADDFAKQYGMALLGRVKNPPAWGDYKAFTLVADRRFFLESGGHPTLKVESTFGGMTKPDGTTWVIIPLGPADQKDLAHGAAYTLRPQNGTPPLQWMVADGLQVVRK